MPSVFISGAARGIGSATAYAFARHGYTVGIYDIDADTAATTAGEITATTGATAHHGALDVTNPDQWRSALAEFASASGGIDVLINNAGILIDGRFEEISLDREHRMVDINFNGVINGAYCGFEYLRTSRGHLVNVCSASAITGVPELAVYGATKMAVRGLSEALDAEWRTHRITVSAMWPLFVQTELLADANTSQMRNLGVNLTPDDVADAIINTVRPTGLRKLLPHTVHHPVGAQAKALFGLADVSPTPLVSAFNRLVVSREK